MADLTSKPRSLSELRSILDEARGADDAERIHAALIDIVDGLITHAAKQGSLIADMRSDLGHKQGIISRIGGGEYTGSQDNVDPRKSDELDL